MSHLRAIYKLGKALIFAARKLARQALFEGRRGDYDTIPQQLQQGLRDRLGIRVKFNEAAHHAPEPVIYAANHMSYLDIVLLGGVLKGSFVSKDSVRNWPVVGAVGASVKTIFIKRTSAALRQTHGQVAAVLNEDRNIILFPEATTTDGDGVVPFKRGLLSLAFNNLSDVPLQKNVQVHPVTIHVTHINDKDVDFDPELRRKYTWSGGDNILNHIWQMAHVDSMDVAITVHDAVNPKDFKDATSFTNAVQVAVASCLPNAPAA